MATNNPSQNNSNISEFNKYLNNNTDILHHKFALHFPHPPPLSDLLSPLHTEAALDYVYDVFNFGKYKQNPTLNQTLRSSLIANLTAFREEALERGEGFDVERAIELLRYCIEHNDMFAVHYDKKKNALPQPNTSPEEESNNDVEA